MVTRVPEPGRGGHPRVVLTAEEEEKLILLTEIGATQQEVAHYFGIDVKTVYNKFNHLFKQGFAKAQVSLRRDQMRAAAAGNTSLLIWLGKQMLAQRDFKETDQQIKDAIEQAISKVMNKETPDE